MNLVNSIPDKKESEGFPVQPPIMGTLMERAARIAVETALRHLKQEPANEETQLFTDVAATWFAFMRHNWNISTYQKNRCLYDTNIGAYFTGKTLSQVDIKCIQGVLDTLEQTHKYSTMKCIKSLIGRILEYAEAQGLIQKNPIHFVSITKGEENHKRALTTEEIHAIIKAAHSHRLWIAPILLVCTGMRRSELLGLEWQDVDLIKGELHITKGYVKLPKNSENRLNPPKSKASRRLIPLDDTVTALLRRYKDQHGDGRTYVISQQKKDKRMNPRDFDMLLKRWCIKAGISRITSHYFRHTFATVAYECEQQTLTIAQQLGHANTRMVEEVYIHPATTAPQRACVSIVSQKILENK